MIKEKIEEVRHLINKFFNDEYLESLDKTTLYENIDDLGLAYTTTYDWDFDDIKEDEFHEVQVSTNILDMSLQTYIDGELLENYKFDSYDDYKLFLENLEFDEMIGDAHDVYKRWKWAQKLERC